MKTAVILLLLAFPVLPLFGQKMSPKQADKSKPIVIGVTEEIQSVQLGETRTLNIYLPEGYNANDTVKYPVIYLLDGGTDEDFIHIVGLVQFNSFDWVGRVPPSIVVGIANSDRKRDFTFPSTVKSEQTNFPSAGHSDKFIAFIEKELQPFISKKYKLNGTRTLIGESLGGLLATEILLKKPYLFDKYIIVSPSLWWDDGSLINATTPILQDTFSHHIEIYIGVGKEGLAPSEKPHMMEVDANLLVERLQGTKCKTANINFDYIPEEDHATIMHQAVYNAMKWMGQIH